MTIQEWLKIGVVVLVTGGLMTSLSIYQKAYAPHPEWVRKLMHMGSGLIALSLPWMFQENLAVIILAILAAAGMFAVKYTSFLRGNLGAVTGNVVRNTLGEICFPLGAGTIFVLSDGDKLLYSIPILILTFADASAALIGIFYGVRRYTTSDGTKTLEGSLAFFQVAFLSTLVPILLFTEVGRAETLLIALLMGLLSMLLDAIAWWGLDNFLIPVLSFLMLDVFIHLDASILTVQLILTIGLMIFVYFWRKRTTLNDSAMLGIVMYGYLCWTLGGWEWMLPPLLLFLSYNALTPTDVAENERPYTVQVMLGVGAVGLFWLIVANAAQINSLYYPFTLSFAAQLAMIGLARHMRVAGHRPLAVLLLRNILLSWLLLFVPFIFIANLGPHVLLYAVAGLLATTLGALLFSLTQTGPDGYRNNTPRWLLQTLSAALASVLGLAAIQIV